MFFVNIKVMVVQLYIQSFLINYRNIDFFINSLQYKENIYFYKLVIIVILIPSYNPRKLLL